MPVHDNFALRVVDRGSLAILSESHTTCIRFGHYLRLFRMSMFHSITDSQFPVVRDFRIRRCSKNIQQTEMMRVYVSSYVHAVIPSFDLLNV